MQTKTFQVEGTNTALTVHLATNFWQRFRGLMLRRPLPPATALLIAPCNSIHMCFMRFAIDAVYLDKQGRILLPANLREYAGIDKEVVSVGVYSRVEIWSKDRYLENSDFDDMDEIADHMAELGIGI